MSAVTKHRSCLSVPGSSSSKLDSALRSEADELVLDLEDAVAANAKDEARDRLLDALSSPTWAEKLVAVRVNAPRSPWCHRDIAALAELPHQPTSIVVPKVETPGDLAFVERLLDGAEAGRRPAPIRVQALIETARGLAEVAEIARSSVRLDALILGYADLAASLGRPADADPGLWLPAQEAVVVAARANGLRPIDGPYLRVGIDAAFESSVRRAREVGFSGKWAIHPAQVGHLTEAFSPTGAELERAHRIVDALERAQAAESIGAIAIDGEMIDEALVAQARDVIARGASGDRP